MKKILSFIIIAVIAFILGGLFSLFMTQHFNWRQGLVFLEKNSKKKVTNLLSRKKKDKADSQGTNASPGTADPVQGNTKEKNKKKSKADKNKDLLDSLWLVKKTDPSLVPDREVGKIFPNVPLKQPEDFKEELFEEGNLLSVPEDLKFASPEKGQIGGENLGKKGQLFWVEVGKFSSLSKAQEVKSYFTKRGYATSLYAKGKQGEDMVYYVRLKKAEDFLETLKKARLIKKVEKITPTLVEVNNEDWLVHYG